MRILSEEKNGGAPALPRLGGAARLAWLPIPAFLAAIALLWAAGSRTPQESAYLAAGLSLVFSTLASWLVAGLMGRAFLAQGLPGPLLMGCGALFWGAAGAGEGLGGALKAGGGGMDVDALVAIHNTCAWLSAQCHLAGVAFHQRGTPALPRPRLWLAAACAASLAAVAFTVVAAGAGWMPVFFVQGQGGTPVRQFVLAAAAAQFAFAASMLRAPRPSAFAHWYSLALLLLAAGLLGVMAEPVAGGALGWTGRAAHFAGGLYMLAAAAGAGGLGPAAPAWPRGAAWHRFGVVLSLAAAAAVARLVFLQGLGTRVSFITFYPAVIAAALYGGFWLGLWAAAASAVLADYFWIEPAGSFAARHTSDFLSLAVFLLSCAMICALAEAMHRARTRAAAAEAEARLAAERALAAEELRYQEEQWRLFFEFTPAALAVVDREMRYLQVSRRWRRDFAPEGQDLVGLSHYEVFPDIPPHWIPAYSRCLAGAVETCEEDTFRRPDGGVEWVRWALQPWRERGGAVGGIILDLEIITERKRVEAALQEQEAVLSSIFGNAPFVMLLVERGGRVHKANKFAQDFVGRPLSGLSFCEALNCARKDNRPRDCVRDPHCQVCGLWALLRDTLANGRDRRQVEMEFEIGTPGQPRRVVALVSAARIAVGNEHQMLFTALDISERKQAEAVRARLAAIVNSSRDAILSKDLGGLLTSWNLGAEALFGYTAEEMLGRPLAPLIPPRLGEAEARILDRVCRGESVEHYETQWLRKDGGLVDVAVTASPVKDDLGRIVGSSKIVRDITERRRVEEERNMYISLVKTSTDFIGMCDANFMPFFVNEAGMRLVGLDGLEQALATPVQEFFFPEDQAFIVSEFFPRVLAEGQGEVEIRFRHFKTAEAIWMLYNVFSLEDSAGRPAGLATVSRNITERKRAEEALREADRRKDEFLAMLAHELRNPLTPIMVAAQLLERGGAGDAKTLRWAAETVKHQGKHLTHLVDQLLDVSRVSRGKITLRKVPLDLRALVERAAANGRPFIDSHRHALAVSLPGEAVWVEADEVRLEQAVGNLLNNAAKYTPDGGRVELALSVEGGMAVLRVRDNGVGLSAAMLPVVFDLFTQAERSLDRSQGGLGIGLALVKSLVEMHGGRVEAASAGAGRGSEFTVRLPLARAAQAAGPAAPPAGPPAAPARRVLVVDDNEFVLASLALLLQSMGHEVRHARDAQEALAAVRAEPVDIALLDIGLPGVNGYELARRLRQDFGPDRLTLVAMTGYNQEHDRLNSRRAGFDFHLVKPFDPQALEAVLQAPGGVAHG